MKLLYALAIFALIVLAAADRYKYKYDYNYEVGFSKIPFKKNYGKIDISFQTTVDSLEWKYSFNAKVEPGVNTTVESSTNYFPEQITNVTFTWTEYDRLRQQQAYFSHFRFIPTYLKNPSQIRLQTKTFCTRPPHRQVGSRFHTVDLFPCQM